MGLSVLTVINNVIRGVGGDATSWVRAEVLIILFSLSLCQLDANLKVMIFDTEGGGGHRFDYLIKKKLQLRVLISLCCLVFSDEARAISSILLQSRLIRDHSFHPGRRLIGLTVETTQHSEHRFSLCHLLSALSNALVLLNQNVFP